MQNILLLGGSGLVGQSLKKILSKKYKVHAPKSNVISILDSKNLAKKIFDIKPAVIINASGFASVEIAEVEKEKCKSLNQTGPALLSKIGKDLKVPIYHVSTDAVFEGSSKKIHDEYDAPSPKSYYAKTKRKGEIEILNASQSNCVVRITMPYSNNHKAKSDIVRKTLGLLNDKGIVTGISDQIINPLFVEDVSNAILHLVELRATGIYHVAASDQFSNLNFIYLLSEIMGHSGVDIKSITLSEFQKKKEAFRSRNCVLGVGRYRADIGELPTVEKSLKNFKAKYKKASS